jgi:hypothetical protein
MDYPLLTRITVTQKIVTFVHALTNNFMQCDIARSALLKVIDRTIICRDKQEQTKKHNVFQPM